MHLCLLCELCLCGPGGHCHLGCCSFVMSSNLCKLMYIIGIAIYSHFLTLLVLLLPQSSERYLSLAVLLAFKTISSSNMWICVCFCYCGLVDSTCGTRHYLILMFPFSLSLCSRLTSQLRLLLRSVN